MRLEPLVEEHREPLRSVAGHPEIWQWIDRRMTLQTVACRRPRSLACRARHAPCVLGRLGFRAPGKNLGSRLSQNPRVCPAPPGVRASKHMLMPVTGVRDSAYFSVIDEEWDGVRKNLEARLAGAREVGSA